MEEKGKKLYTLLVYSENVAGILNQVTAVFTRRQVNIESLNVSASSIPGVHKYTITAWSDEDQIIRIARQIEKKIDVVKANYFTDDQLFIRESGLYKLATDKVMENPEISRTIRRFDAHIIEVNPTYTIAMKHGITVRLCVAVYPLWPYRRHTRHAGAGERILGRERTKTPRDRVGSLYNGKNRIIRISGRALPLRLLAAAFHGPSGQSHAQRS